MTLGEVAVALALTLALNGAVLTAATLAARRLLPEAERSERFLAAATLAVAFIIYPQLAIGAAGALSLAPLAGVACVSLLVVFWLWRRRPKRPAPPHSAARPPARDPAGWALAGLYACAGTYLLERALSLPPLSWDGLFYHLPMVVEWSQTGSLDPLYHPSGYHHSYFPGSGELFFLWALLPWKNDLLAGAVDLPLLAVQAVAVYRIARELGAEPSIARWAPALYILTPCVARFAGSSHVEPALAATLLLSLNWLLVLRRARSPTALYLISAALGVAIGVKYTAVVYAIPIAVAALAYAWRMPRRFAHITSAIALPLLGAYWYWRNIALTGNPIYPNELSFFGRTIFEGAPLWIGDFDLSGRRSILSNAAEIFASGDLWKALLGSWPTLPDVGIGPKILALFGLALVGATRGARASLLVALIALCWLATFLVIPYWSELFFPYNVRFLGPALALLACLAVLPLSRAPPGLVALVALLCVLPDALALPRELTVSTGWALFTAALSCVLLRWIPPFARWTRSALIATGLLGVAVLLFASFAISQARESNRRTHIGENWKTSYADGWSWLDQQLANAPARVAFVGSEPFYPLHGPRWTRTVRYVDVNRRAGGAHHAYPLGGFRETPDAGAWVENLRRFGASYLVVARHHLAIEWPLEAAWAEQRFPIRAEGPRIRIYEVTR